MAMIKIDNTNYKQELVEDKGFKVVLFGASWCGPCRMYHPVVHEFAEKYPEVKLCANDVDESTEAAAMFGIQSVPTTIIMKNGSEVTRVSGGMSLEDLEKFVEDNK
ncbi:MAG: thioredoxin family protein [Selenomonadales bacterium]|nr:thioredoxin family protein [Selenomonadales bacterium]MEE1361599.1 thioredoxin family protein [Selenomonadaceae bacterium]